MVQRFGGQWTLLKLEAVEKYLHAYTSALKNQPYYRLAYFDAFAGTGEFKPLRGSVVHRGSARIALETIPQFAKFEFIEGSRARARKLAAVTLEYPNRCCNIHCGDANEKLIELIDSHDWKKWRAILFLDPYGMSVNWSTLQRVAATKAIDVWYLFPLAGLFRQLALSADGIDEAKSARITAILGTAEWRQVMYEQPRQTLLWGIGPDQRQVDWVQIAEFATTRLRTIFASVLDPYILRGDKGTPLFSLYFAVSNPNVAAIRLANKMARNILSGLDKKAA